jgi:tyrosyl-tRNA synthetase
VAKPTGKGGGRQTLVGARIARERAARRRAARERAEREAEAAAGSQIERGTKPQPDTVREVPVAAVPAEPEIVDVPLSDLANELSVLAAVISSGLARHHPEARRLFRDVGIRVNGEAIVSDKAKLTQRDVAADGTIELAVGERRVRLRPA